ncbi:MAG: hypothetical protein QGI33_00700, partial [Candidatus Brocadiia bacterium]|nr:hypothetical protein [Candidatus Brocadiia bacterium]
MKIACVGAGGWFFAKRLGDVAVTEGLHGATIALYDIDRQKADMTARLARRFSDEAGAGLKVECASSLAEAVEGASFVLACVGGAGATGPGGYFESPTHIGDCAISARHGVYHIVGCTTGPVAMMAAFRCIPIYLDICREMERHAP